jgi:hypothetical protein
MAVTAVKPDSPSDEPLGIDSLTAAETALAEKQAGQSIVTLGNLGYPQTALLGALGWVLHRRTDPRMTFAAYMEGRTLTEITRELHLGSDDEEVDEGKDSAG